jgi:DNA topoisomerase-1
VRDESKYERLAAFAQALPTVRRRVTRDLALPGLPRVKILAAVVQLLERTLIRVGNGEYARTNDSFGLTTLRDRHLRIEGTRVTFVFRGKSGIQHNIALSDTRLAAIIRKSRDLPGYELFQYLDEDQQRRSIDAADVNTYLRDIAGQDFTAKDFRTWMGTVLALQILVNAPTITRKREATRNITRTVADVAARLGNTSAICRKYYIHPEILTAYSEGRLPAANATTRRLSGLSADETAVLRLLMERPTSTQQRKRARIRAKVQPLQHSS